MSSMGEEDGEDVDESKRGKIDEKLQKYMKQMDQELSGTTIGQSFEKKTSEVFFVTSIFSHKLIFVCTSGYGGQF
jgi:hypothetical protein